MSSSTARPPWEDAPHARRLRSPPACWPGPYDGPGADEAALSPYAAPLLPFEPVVPLAAVSRLSGCPATARSPSRKTALSGPRPLRPRPFDPRPHAPRIALDVPACTAGTRRRPPPDHRPRWCSIAVRLPAARAVALSCAAT